jgi:hypothetical protein
MITQEQLYLDPIELSKRIGVCIGTLGQWRARRAYLPYSKFGKNVRYLVTDIEAYEKRAVVKVAA